MRKVFTVAFTVMLCVLTFVALVSCANNTEESTATVSFSVSGDDNEYANLKWFYKANLADKESTSKIGQTTDYTLITIDSETKKSDPITISCGNWNFVLIAVDTSEGTEEFGSDKITGTQVYSGVANNVLVKSTTTEIAIEVSAGGASESVAAIELVTDGSMGNVYNWDTNEYLHLVEKDGVLAFTETAPNAGANLELLDCTLSNDISDEYIYDENDTHYQTGYVWTVYHSEDCGHSFAPEFNAFMDGGCGTKLEPYLVSSLDIRNGPKKSYDTYYYYKWTNKRQIVDCTSLFWAYSIHGSFDGNGATFDNTNAFLFGNIGYNSDKTTVLKNFNVKANYAYFGYGTGVVCDIWHDTVFRNINVSGTIFSSFSSAFGSYLNNPDLNITFENCTSNVELINASVIGMHSSGILENGAFLGRMGKGTGSTINLNNSIYTGNFYIMRDSDETLKTNYNYVIGGDTDSTITIKENPAYSNLYSSTWMYTLQTYELPYRSNDIVTSATNSLVIAESNAVSADFYWFISSSDKGFKINLKQTVTTKTGGNFVSDLTDYTFRYNQKETGVHVEDGVAYYDYSYEGGTSSNFGTAYKRLIAIQRDSSNKIIKISFARFDDQIYTEE